MQSSSPPSLTCTNINLFKPCKKFLFKLFKRPISIKPFCRFRNLRNLARRMSPNRSRRSKFRSVRAVFRPLLSTRPSTERIDRVGELPSLTDRVRAPLSSPVTPAYVKFARLRREESAEGRDDEAEEACRSFESYLMEMLVEERRVRDLMDVEELLYCWESLKCPAFVELTCRFYGELCKDLFSNIEGEVVDEEEPVSTYL